MLIHSRTYTFLDCNQEVEADYGPTDVRITCIRYNSLSDEDNGAIWITSGGIGHDFVKLKFRSKYSRGLHYRVFVYGQPTLRRSSVSWDVWCDSQEKTSSLISPYLIPSLLFYNYRYLICFWMCVLSFFFLTSLQDNIRKKSSKFGIECRTCMYVSLR